MAGQMCIRDRYVCMPYQENRRGGIFEKESAGDEGIKAEDGGNGENVKTTSAGKAVFVPVDYRIVQTDTGAVLTCVDRNSGEVRVFEWKAELVFEERRQMGEEEHGRRLSSLQAAWQEEREGWELQKEEIQAEALAKLGELQQEREAVSYTHLDVYKRQAWDGGFVGFCFLATTGCILLSVALSFFMKKRELQGEFVQALSLIHIL